MAKTSRLRLNDTDRLHSTTHTMRCGWCDARWTQHSDDTRVHACLLRPEGAPEQPSSDHLSQMARWAEGRGPWPA